MKILSPCHFDVRKVMMLIMVSPPLLRHQAEPADEEFLKEFELKVCFASWRIITYDAVKLLLGFRLRFSETEIDAAGVCSVVQLEVEQKKKLAQNPQAGACKQPS